MNDENIDLIDSGRIALHIQDLGCNFYNNSTLQCNTNFIE